MFRKLFGELLEADCSDAEKLHSVDTSSQGLEPRHEMDPLGEDDTSQNSIQNPGSSRRQRSSSERKSSSTRPEEERQPTTSATNGAAERKRKTSVIKGYVEHQPEISAAKQVAKRQRKTVSAVEQEVDGERRSFPDKPEDEHEPRHAEPQCQTSEVKPKEQGKRRATAVKLSAKIALTFKVVRREK